MKNAETPSTNAQPAPTKHQGGRGGGRSVKAASQENPQKEDDDGDGETTDQVDDAGGGNTVASKRRRPARPKRKQPVKPASKGVAPAPKRRRTTTERKPPRGRAATPSKSLTVPLVSPVKQEQLQHLPIARLPPRPTSSLAFVKSPIDVTSALLELLLERQTIINRYFGLAESMLLREATGGPDERFFTWITLGKKPFYNDVFLPQERRARAEALNGFAVMKREEHRKAMARLSSIGFLTDEILAESVPPAPVEIKETVATKDHARSEATATWISEWIRRDQMAERMTTIQQSGTALANFDCLEFLTSPVVHLATVTYWSPRELVLFELALCRFGQNFARISSAIRTKSYKECYSFYAEVFKQSTRYKLFKEHKKLAPWYGL